MTRPYLVPVASSSSSMGGLVMPSGTAAAPDTLMLLQELGDSHQGYQPITRLTDRRIEDDLVELVLRGELDPGGVQAGADHPGVLGAASGQPADQLVPARRGEEDKESRWHG